MLQQHHLSLGPARQESLQALRALAALMVVLFHAGGAIAAPKYQDSALIGSLTYGFDIGVDLFFVISGFVIALPLFQGGRKDPGRFLSARLSRVYPMAVVTCAIYIAAGFYVMETVPKPFWGVAISSALLVPAPWEPIPFILWTLKHEVLFYALFSIVYVNERIGLAIVTAWAVASMLFASEHWLGGWLFLPQHIEFLFGIAASALFCRHRVSSRIAFPILVIASVGFLFGAFAEEHLNTNLKRQALACGLSGMAIVYSAACIKWRDGLWTFLGDASYSIYLMHWIAISAANKVMYRFPVADYLALIAVFLVATGGGVIYYLMIERQLERWRKSKFAVRDAGRHLLRFPASASTE
jgi:exopolysaccharide production protein ExoZ